VRCICSSRRPAATLAAREQAYRIGAAPAEAEVEPFRELLAKASPEEAEGMIDREFFGRLCTAAMLPSLEAACDDWRPGLVLHETCEYSAAVAAGRRGIPHAQVAISLAQVEASALAHTVPALEAYGGRIGEQIKASGYLTRFPPSVDPSPYPATRRFRETGPGEAGRPSSAPLPDWWEGNEAPLVYVTFGTMAGGTAVGDAAFRAALDAVSGLPIRVLLTAGRATDIQALDGCRRLTCLPPPSRWSAMAAPARPSEPSRPGCPWSSCRCLPTSLPTHGWWNPPEPAWPWNRPASLRDAPACPRQATPSGFASPSNRYSPTTRTGKPRGVSQPR
jgi:hypothetical protein